MITGMICIIHHPEEGEGVRWFKWQGAGGCYPPSLTAEAPGVCVSGAGVPGCPRVQLRVSADATPAYGHRCPGVSQGMFLLPGSEKQPARGAPMCTGDPGV